MKREDRRGSPRRGGLLATVIGVAVLGAGAWAAEAALQQNTFPHARHSGLFPLCTGCHEGIPQGDQSRFYPAAEFCALCHDGVNRVEVSWSPPSDRPSNLKFQHDSHPQFTGDPEQSCAMCHNEPGTDRMAVTDEVQLELCWRCHTATSHQVDADCAFCHVPLAESGFGLADIESISMPADHEDSAYLLEGHGQLAREGTARCATCHTQDRCVACHVDTDRPEIQALAAAPDGMELPPLVSYYEKPSTHEDPDDWLGSHGSQASREACATCHTQDDCRSCHVAPLPPVFGTLPTRDQVIAPGVGVTPRAPSSHGSVFFLDVHTSLAASNPGNCSTCHEDSFCVSCHAGPSDGGYHPAGFVARHSADAFGRSAECANCHSTEAFCRECHVQSGLTGFGRLGPGYHLAGALWLIRHGQAARQGLESCITCHKQTDCTQCHGVAGAFKINPHGSDFDPERAWERSPRTCIACHLRNPLIGGEP
jgi:predicted CXXCH cytochrome family protein